MECSYGHASVQMVEKNRADGVYRLTITYVCPTCECEKEYIYDIFSKSANIRTVKEGVFQKREKDKEKRETEEKEQKEKNRWKEEASKQRRYREEQRIREEAQQIQCANNHPPIYMVTIARMNYDGGYGYDNGIWFQCPECYEKKLKCREGIFNEIKGKEWENRILAEQREARKREKEEQERQNKLQREEYEKKVHEDNQRKLEEQKKREIQKIETQKKHKEFFTEFVYLFIIGLGIYFAISLVQGILISKFLFTFVASSADMGGSLLRLIYGPIIIIVLAGIALLEWAGIEKLLDDFVISNALGAIVIGILSGLLAQLVYAILRFSLVYLSFTHVHAQKVSLEMVEKNLILFPIKAGVFGIMIFAAVLIVIIYPENFPKMKRLQKK